MADENVVDGADAGAEAAAEASGQEAPGGEGAQQEGGEAGARQVQARGEDGRFKRIRIPIKGKGGKVEYLEGTEEELGQKFLLPSEAYRHIREANELRAQREQERKEAETREKALMGDPAAFRQWVRDTAKRHGMGEKDAHALLVRALKRDIEDMQKDPRERELEQLRKEREERAARDKEAAAKAEKERLQKEQQEALEKHRPVFLKRLGNILQEGKLPQNDMVLSIAADQMLANKGLGLTDKELAEFTRDECVNFAASITEGWTGEDVERLMPGLFKAVHKTLATRAKERSGGGGGVSREPGAVQRTEAEPTYNGRRPPPRPMTREEEREIFEGRRR